VTGQQTIYLKRREDVTTIDEFSSEQPPNITVGSAIQERIIQMRRLFINELLG